MIRVTYLWKNYLDEIWFVLTISCFNDFFSLAIFPVIHPACCLEGAIRVFGRLSVQLSFFFWVICIRFFSRRHMLCSVKSSHVLGNQFFQISLKNSQFFGNEFLTTCYCWRRNSWRLSCCWEIHMRVCSRGQKYIWLFFQPSSENSHFTIKKFLILLHCK